jgi:hypothetical protein
VFFCHPEYVTGRVRDAPRASRLSPVISKKSSRVGSYGSSMGSSMTSNRCIQGLKFPAASSSWPLDFDMGAL